MTRYPTIFSFLLSAFIFVSFILLKQHTPEMGAGGGISIKHNPGVTELMHVEMKTPPEQLMSILFIGNSYTFFNNMPGMLAAIASSDPNNKIAIEVQAVTNGGVALKDLWKTGEAKPILAQRKWDYVVLQDQSFWAFQKANILETTSASLNWTREIMAVGAKPVVFMNWPRQPGSPWYSNPQYAFLKNPDYSYQRFHNETNKLAKKLNAGVAPAGDYWYFAQQQYPELVLYGADGSHPAVEGTFLSALVLYRYFTGHSPAATTYTPPGVPEDHAKTLRIIASYGEKP